MTTRKTCLKGFKLDAVSLALEQGYTRTDEARILDINASMLGRWVQEHQVEDDHAFRGNDAQTNVLR